MARAQRCVLGPQVSICLECNSSKLRGLKRKWIRCSAQATVLHLKKFIAKKLNLSSFNEVACPAAREPRPARGGRASESLGSAALEMLNQKKDPESVWPPGGVAGSSREDGGGPGRGEGAWAACFQQRRLRRTLRTWLWR